MLTSQHQLTRLEQSGSGYELRLILSLSGNRAASVLGRDLASYRLRRGPAVHVFRLPGAQLALPFRDAIDRLAAQVFGPWSSAGIVN